MPRIVFANCASVNGVMRARLCFNVYEYVSECLCFTFLLCTRFYGAFLYRTDHHTFIEVRERKLTGFSTLNCVNSANA